MHKQDKQSCN